MKTVFFAILASALFASCASPWMGLRTDFGNESAGRAFVRITEGNAVLTVSAQVSRDVYWGSAGPRDPFEERKPLLPAGAVTRNETLRLSAGEERTFRTAPSETIIVHIVSANGQDVKAIIRNSRGVEREHAVSGGNALGIRIVL